MKCAYVRNSVILATVLLIGIACGREYADTYETAPPPPPPGTSTGTGTGTGPAPDRFAAVKPKVDQFCGTCHNGRNHPLKLDNAAAFKRARARIANNSMPPGGGLPAPVKAEFLEFIDRG